MRTARGTRPDLAREDQKVKKYVDEALRALNPDGSQSGSNILRFDLWKRLLAHLIPLAGVNEVYARAQLIHRALVETKKNLAVQADPLECFWGVLDRLVTERQQRPTKRFLVILPLNLRDNQIRSFRSIRVLGLTVRRRTWRELEQQVQLSAWAEKADHVCGYNKGAALLMSSYVPLEIAVVAQAADEAWARAYRAFELLRAALNLQDTWGRTKIIHGGPPQPLGGLRPAPIYGVFDAGGAEVCFYYTTVPLDRSASAPRDRDWRAVRQLIQRLNAIHSEDIRDLVVDALLKYGEAVETVEWRQAFLALWQILELMALQSEGNTNMREVCGHIALLLGQCEQDRDLLAALAVTRNTLVHAGHYPDDYGLDEMQFLKGVVERAIDSLWTWASRIDGRQPLRLLYGCLGAADGDLRQRVRVINAVQGWRKRTKGMRH